ncbi:MAG: mechanosensitive ion channel family protein [Candidatus Paceibacterota bacterium]
MEIINSIIENIKNFYFWEETFLSNSLGDYAVALVVFAVLFVVFKIVQLSLLNKLTKLAKKTSTKIDDTLIKIARSIKPSFYFFLSLYIAVKALVLLPIIQTVIDVVIIVWVIYQVVIALQIFLNYLFNRLEDKEDLSAEGAGSRKMAIQLLGKIAKGVLWTIAVLMILSNLGVNITSLIAGLGIGGVAVALALQNVLGDLFSAFVIYFDKPFVVGDFIIVGESMGTVERIGIKTTRIRALQGEEIIMSNTDLVSGEIHNFKRMSDRRIVFEVGVEYDTHQDNLEKIPEIVKKSFEGIKDVRFARAHLKKFGDSAFLFEIVYNVLAADFDTYMDRNQEILLNIRKGFQKEGIEFAFPTRTLYVNNK